MRCDQPTGHDEDYLDTPCEMFVQFMFQNAELSDSSDSDDHLPIVHSPSASPSSGESSGDEAESVFSLTDLLNYAEDVTSNMLGDVQSVSTVFGDMENISNALVDVPGVSFTLGDKQDTSNTLGDGQSASNTLGDGQVIPNTLDGAEDVSNILDIVEGIRISQNLVKDLSISEEPCSLENDPFEVYQLVDECTDDLPENDNMCNPENEDDSVDIYEIVDESTEDFSEGPQSVTSENSENCTIPNVVSEETNDCKCVPKELPVQVDTSPNDYNAPSSGTCTSLSVVVPPTSFCNELKMLSQVSSDGFLSDVAPINPPSSSLCLSDDGNIPTEDESLYTVNKICDNCEELVPNSSAVCSYFSVSENDDHPNMSELDSVLGMENSVSSISKSENTIDFHKNLVPEFDTCDDGLSAEVNIQLVENASCDAASDKSVPNLKRKAFESVGDNIIKKVPKFTLAHDSDEFSAVAVENYSDESSGDAEMSCFTPSTGDAETPFLAPFIDDTENAILPLEKYDDETSITE